MHKGLAMSAANGHKERLNPQVLVRAKKALARRLGLRFDDRNLDMLEAGLRKASETAQTPAEALINRFDESADARALQPLVRHITIGETYFFRHPEDWAMLRETLLPRLAEARPEPGVLRAWSAGCSTGEEAYSLAIALRQALPERLTPKVLGTDINQAALVIGRRGSYGRWSRRSKLPIPPQYVHAEQGEVRVVPEIRELVRFSYLNLMDDAYPDLASGTVELDLIFCRNVLLYFTPDAVKRVLSKLAQALKPDGYLVVSALDASALPEGLERVRADVPNVLQKKRPRLTPRMPGDPPSQPPIPPTSPPLSPPVPLEVAAKAAADAKDLVRAEKLARRALSQDRSAAVLHLLALIVSERGQPDEARALLREAITVKEDYLLGHLALGMLDLAAGENMVAAERFRWLLKRLKELDADATLPGPEPLSVTWARQLVKSSLERALQSQPPRQVVVVGDSSQLRHALARHLGGLRCELLEVPDGVEALRLVQEVRPALLFADSKENERQGLSITRALKLNEDFARLPVVFVTPPDDALAAEIAALPGAVHLVKPLEMKQLATRLMSCLQPEPSS